MSVNFPKRVVINEVCLRDGLQNSKKRVPLDVRRTWLRGALNAGLRRMEVGSFVDYTRVEQMRCTPDLCNDLPHAEFPDARFSVLVPNRHYLGEALKTRAFAPEICATGAAEIAVFLSATEEFSQANLGADIATSIEKARKVTEMALPLGIRVRGYVSACFVCPISTQIVLPTNVIKVTDALLQMGCYEIAISDTNGLATSKQVDTLYTELARANLVPPEHFSNRFAVHFHDTNEQAITNIATAFQHGITTIDTALADLGGCPFAGEGVRGNVATEKVVAWCHANHVETGIHLAAIDQLAASIKAYMGSAALL